MSWSLPVPPSSPAAVAFAVLSLFASAAPAPTPSLESATASDTVTASAPAATFFAVIAPRLARTSFPAPPSMPVAETTAVALVSASAAPSAAPSFATRTAAATPTAVAVDAALSTLMAPRLLMVSSPAPPSTPMAVEAAWTLASTRAAPAARPLAVPSTVSATLTAWPPAPALTPMLPSLLISSLPELASMPLATAWAWVLVSARAAPIATPPFAMLTLALALTLKAFACASTLIDFALVIGPFLLSSCLSPSLSSCLSLPSRSLSSCSSCRSLSRASAAAPLLVPTALAVAVLVFPVSCVLCAGAAAPDADRRGGRRRAGICQRRSAGDTLFGGAFDCNGHPDRVGVGLRRRGYRSGIFNIVPTARAVDAGRARRRDRLGARQCSPDRHPFLADRDVH